MTHPKMSLLATTNKANDGACLTIAESRRAERRTNMQVCERPSELTRFLTVFPITRSAPQPKSVFIIVAESRCQVRNQVGVQVCRAQNAQPCPAHTRGRLAEGCTQAGPHPHWNSLKTNGESQRRPNPVREPLQFERSHAHFAAEAHDWRALCLNYLYRAPVQIKSWHLSSKIIWSTRMSGVTQLQVIHACPNYASLVPNDCKDTQSQKMQNGTMTNPTCPGACTKDVSRKGKFKQVTVPLHGRRGTTACIANAMAARLDQRSAFT